MPWTISVGLDLMEYRLNQPEVKTDLEVKVLDQPQQVEEPRMLRRQLHSKVDLMLRTTSSANSRKAPTMTVEPTEAFMVPRVAITAHPVAMLIDRRVVGSAVFHSSRSPFPFGEQAVRGVYILGVY